MSSEQLTALADKKYLAWEVVDKAVLHAEHNSILNLSTMPQTWCGGLITPIYKSGGRRGPANYRGICVSGCLRKLFCSILNQRLLEHVNSYNILHNSQIGFLP